MKIQGITDGKEETRYDYNVCDVCDAGTQWMGYKYVRMTYHKIERVLSTQVSLDGVEWMMVEDGREECGNE